MAVADNQVVGLAVDVLVSLVQPIDSDVVVFVYRTVGVVEAVAKQPVVGLGDVECACQAAVAHAGELGETQAGTVAALGHGVDDLFGLRHRHGAVGSAVQYPKGKVVKSAVRLGVAAAAERHCRGDAVGIGGGIVDGAVASEAHADDVETVGVARVVVEDPVYHVVYSLRIPGSAGILRGDDDGVDLASHFQGVEGSIAPHPFEVVSA